MKSSTINTTLGLIALATMSFAASNAQANHDTTERFNTPYYGQPSYGQPSNGQWGYGRRHAQRANQQRLTEIDARQAQQRDRIKQGWQNGNLTHPEYHALLAEQQFVRSMERDFMADGFLSPFEFRKLDNALDTADRNIRAEKHDHDTRASYEDNSRYGHRWGNYR